MISSKNYEEIGFLEITYTSLIMLMISNSIKSFVLVNKGSSYGSRPEITC